VPSARGNRYGHKNVEKTVLVCPCPCTTTLKVTVRVACCLTLKMLRFATVTKFSQGYIGVKKDYSVVWQHPPGDVMQTTRTQDYEMWTCV
jgi:hypothetical protein